MSEIKSMVFEETDNVAFLPGGAEAGDVLDGLQIAENICPGHKVARRRIPAGEPVRRWGRVIGVASCNIARGSLVHSHNVIGLPERRKEGFVKGFFRALSELARPKTSGMELSFKGYRRAAGRPGIRNELWLIALSPVAGRMVEKALRDYRRPNWMHTPKLITLDTSGLGADSLTAGQRALIASFSSNPNAAASLYISAEGDKLSGFDAGRTVVSQGKRQIEPYIIEDSAESAVALCEKLDQLSNLAPRTRIDYPLSSLAVGLIPTDDIFASSLIDPAIGGMSELLHEAGAATVAAVPAWLFHVEGLLEDRIAAGAVLREYLRVCADIENFADSPIIKSTADDCFSTLAERAVSEALKWGNVPITAFGEPGRVAGRNPGLEVLALPHFGDGALTLLAASGAQLVCAGSRSPLSPGGALPLLNVVCESADDSGGDYEMLADRRCRKRRDHFARMLVCALAKVASGHLTTNECRASGGGNAIIVDVLNDLPDIWRFCS